MTPAHLSLLFSIKLFIAAMIAFAIAVSIGLPQPYWALVTCCVVINPLTGAVRSKAVYRFAGTAAGGLVAILLAAVFSSIPLLLIVGSGLAATAAFACSVLDRTPRGYGFGLFGITLMLVAVAGADHPESMFDTAVARVCEISLGIIAATVVDSVIVPRSLGGTLRRRLRGWLPDVEAWMHDALAGRVADAQAEHDRLKIIADVTALSALTGQLRYDPTVPRRDLQIALAIQTRLLRLIPLLSAVGARIAAFAPADHAAMDSLLREVKATLDDGMASDSAGYQPLIERIRAVPVAPGEDAAWHHLVRDTLCDLLGTALQTWREVTCLKAALDGAPLDPDLERRMRQTSAFPLVPDWNFALSVAGGILVTYTLLCGLWWATGWHQGAGAALIGTVALAFFWAPDDPGPAIAKFASFTVIAFASMGLLNYGLLPLAHDYPTFVIAMALFMLPLGVWASSNPMALLLLVMGLSSINLQAQYNPVDIGTYLETMFANLVGIFVAFSCSRLFRAVGPAHAFARFARKEREDVARLTRQAATPHSRDAYINRALDRIAAMTQRLSAAGRDDQSVRLLERLRAGVGVAEVRRTSATLSGEARAAVEALLAGVRREAGRSDDASPTLLALLDGALSAAWRADQGSGQGSGGHALLRALAGLRLARFGSAPAWVPAS